jgi:hypothetical protein
VGTGLLALTPAVPALAAVSAPSGGALTVVGSDPLGGRGMNAALTVAGHCAYVGSRNDAAPQVLDIADPTHPRVVGALPAHPGSTPRELRAVESQHLVVVLFYRLGGGINGLDIYRWTTDCAAPTLLGHYDFGSAAPHEFYLWQDPASPARILLFVTMFGASPGLQVVDISNPVAPVRVGTWTVPGGYGHAPVHSISISADARTAYVSLWTGGMVVADVSDFTAGRPQPALRPYTQPGAVFSTPPGNVHSAVPLIGQSLVMTTDERYPTPYGAGCPFGTAHIVDVSDPAHPSARATIAVPENVPAACAAAPRGTYTSHNATMTSHLAFITWYSSGIEVVGLDDPSQPVRLAELRPGGVSPVLRDLQLGVTDTMSWSYPVIVRGLIYVADINQGLLVLRYTGAHQDEVAGLGFAEGNSNLTAVIAATPSPAEASPSAASRPSPAPGSVRPKSTGSPKAEAWQVLLMAILGVLVARAVISLWQRRRRARDGPSKL